MEDSDMKLEVGKKYLTRNGRETVVKYIDTYGIATTHWGSKVWADSGEVIRDKKSDGDLVRLVSDSPVREVTRREIVPGTYGRVVVGTTYETGIWFEIADNEKGALILTAEELDNVAMIASQLAEALRDV